MCSAALPLPVSCAGEAGFAGKMRPAGRVRSAGEAGFAGRMRPAGEVGLAEEAGFAEEGQEERRG